MLRHNPSPHAALRHPAISCCLGELSQLHSGAEDNSASPVGPSGNQPQADSSKTLLPIPSSLLSQFPWFIPWEKTRASPAWVTSCSSAAAAQYRRCLAKCRCAQMWSKTLLQQGNNQQQEHGLGYCCLNPIFCKAAGCHSISYPENLPLETGATCSQSFGLAEKTANPSLSSAAGWSL